MGSGLLSCCVFARLASGSSTTACRSRFLSGFGLFLPPPFLLPAPPRPETASNASARAQLRSSPSGAPQPQGEGGERKGPPREEPRPHKEKRKQERNGQAYGQTRGGLTIPSGEEGGRREPNRELDSPVGTCEWLQQQQQGNIVGRVRGPFVVFGAYVLPASSGSLCLRWALPPPPRDPHIQVSSSGRELGAHLV